MKPRSLIPLLALGLALMSCARAGDRPAAATSGVVAAAEGGAPSGGVADRNAPVVAVSILPQREFVERIAGDRVRVIVLVSQGQSPHSWEPSPRQLAELGGAAVWFLAGIDFERSLRPKVEALYPSLRVIDASAGIPRRSLEEHGHEGEDSHAEEASGAGTGLDMHTWLGHDEAKAHLKAVRDGLAAADPAGAADYSKNYELFAAEVDGVFGSLARELAPLRGKPVFVYHPAFGYFLDEFGIVQVAVETGGKEPTQKNLAELVERARSEGARAIFVQAQFPTAAARSLAAAIGGVVEPLDDLAPDWLANLRRMGEALRKAAG